MERATPWVLALLTVVYAAVTLHAHLDRGTHRADDALTEEEIAGRRAWNRHNCTACHQLYGLGGYLGPDLTNSYSTRGPQHLRHVLRNGFQIMPKLDLTETEVGELVEFLRAVDRTGTFPQRKWPPESFPNR